jgi:hypothetical protein
VKNVTNNSDVMMQLKLPISDKPRSISSKSLSGRGKYFLLFLGIILGSLVWVGAQLDSSQRIESLKWLIPKGILDQEIISPYFDHLQIIIDTIYEAVEATKVACFIWSKVI